MTEGQRSQFIKGLNPSPSHVVSQRVSYVQYEYYYNMYDCCVECIISVLRKLEMTFYYSQDSN